MMARYSLRLLFLRKYRTSKKIYKQLRSNKPIFPVISQRDRATATNGFNGSNETDASRSSAIPRRRRGNFNNSQDSVDCCLLICDCVRQHKLATFVFILVAGLLTTSGLFMHHQKQLQYKVYRGDVFSAKHGIRLKRCTLPVLKPFSKQVQPFISYSEAPNCAHGAGGYFFESPFKVKNGNYLEMRAPLDGCCYRSFHRRGDTDVWTHDYCQPIVEDRTWISNDMDYIEVICSGPAETNFKDGFALIPKKSRVEKRIRDYEGSKNNVHPRLSVIVLGMDATSRMNFLRAMPKANEYLLGNLSAVTLNGYTKVAENTLPNMIPFLTGRTLEEFKKECIDESWGSSEFVHIDDCPFVWKRFAGNGYRTSFAEDDVDISMFNLNWPNAFVSPPTDYYLRPFSMLMQRQQGSNDDYCYGPSLSFEKLLDNVISLAEAFASKSYFQLTWSTKLSHNDFNKMRWGDEPLLQFLKYMDTNNYLNNTALLVVGDHGSRLDKIRSTVQGKLEDRMPLAYVVLPPWFKDKYKQAFLNLQQNSGRVTSAFDMHKTLYDFMNLDRLLGDNPALNETIQLAENETVHLNQYRGSSLFRELKNNRTCFEAGVPLHWCVCHRKIPPDKDSKVVKQAAEFIVDSINILLEDFVSSCAILALKSIDEVSKWDPKEIVRNDCDDGEQVFSNESSIISPESATKNDCSGGGDNILILQVALTTNPGEATFETTVIQLLDGGWRLTEDVARTNSYAGQSKCVEQKMKPYCYCDDSFL